MEQGRVFERVKYASKASKGRCALTAVMSAVDDVVTAGSRSKLRKCSAFGRVMFSSCGCGYSGEGVRN